MSEYDPNEYDAKTNILENKIKEINQKYESLKKTVETSFLKQTETMTDFLLRITALENTLINKKVISGEEYKNSIIEVTDIVKNAVKAAYSEFKEKGSDNKP